MTRLLQAVGGNTTVGYYKHQNIRFAKVPTGDLRFAAPEWPDVETEINTRKLANIDVECKTSEDRQYLDVWPPANAAGRNLPVLVWTYGGGFTGGSKSENTPEGLFDLIQDFVFVAYNYRVGITGLTNGPAYQHEGGVSNPCVWDSTHAFEWVQKYISKFGGNPNDVTAAGFSAGASQVMFQMTRFGGNAPQLFQKAYIMSPGYEDVSTYLRIFFPGISDDAVDKLLELYPEADYESAGLRFADMKQSFDLTAKNLALTNALNNQTWNAQVSLGEATHCFDQNYYWYSTYSLSTASESSSATTSSLSSDEAASVGAVTTTVNATIAVMMQKYLMSFVLAGNPNSIWADDKIYWPLYNESRVGTQIVFNDTFTVADDDLANAKRLFWNKALWY
ncbi:Lipase 1 [Phytophthora cinnamomi]|uniref:Lipase 1 n=1 Tax=Phytophthora cinnamomi TaxID=4785 RepID=UPI00355A2409|nr:Lipase 1 [Phytophthora cinnamomi]